MNETLTGKWCYRSFRHDRIVVKDGNVDDKPQLATPWAPPGQLDVNTDEATGTLMFAPGVALEVMPSTGTEERGLGLVESLQAQEPALALLSRPGGASPAPDSGASPAPMPFSINPAQPVAGVGGGRRRALCVGIDRYPTAPLGGCANDAREWRQAFQDFGFEEPKLLLDGEATRAGRERDDLRRPLPRRQQHAPGNRPAVRIRYLFPI
ncbi:MAG: caspase family protein [Gammaproteobacteria bacterium]